ncbi:MAG TPA: sensor histidine kinase [Chthoniobacter sp.]|nr:sensor histidine kinase [Chthoniobacter sp.]
MKSRTPLLEKLGQQPKSWLMAESLACLALVAGIDLLTTWQFSMFIFYCLPVYAVSLYFPRKTAIAFVIFAEVLATIAAYDSIPVRGLGGYAWAALNRLGGFLFAAACGLSFQSYREEMQHRFQALQRTRELEREIVKVGELEQQRIGQDLHDGVCQTLAALDCAAQCLKIDLEKDGSPRIVLAMEIQKQLSAATLEARNMARGIFPVSISADSLANAVEDLVANMNRLFGGIIVFVSDDEILVRDADEAMHLYRITQEALSNAMRHANATHIEVRLKQQEGKLTVVVADDGSGSAIQNPKRPDGMGWHTMRYRSNLIGADLSIHTEPGKGTEIRCVLPLGGVRIPVQNAALA